MSTNSGSSQAADRSLRWIARLAFFLLVLALCFGTTVLLLTQVSGVVGEGELSIGLDSIEHLYLGRYLADNEEALRMPIGEGEGLVAFVIEPGTTADEIASNLENAGILVDATLFKNYVRYHDMDQQLEAGTYEISASLTVPELALTLSRALAADIEVRFIEGWRYEQMADYLDAVKPANIDPEAFIAIVERREPIDLSGYDFLNSLPSDAPLEGFLFPDTYRLAVDAGSEALVKLMLDNFAQRVSPQLRQGFGSQGLTVYEAVSLASIVQREAVVPDERPLMVGVFLNRLEHGMLLQADPTVQYALGWQQALGKWWKVPLTATDLQVDSPYNTYLYPGLPPGPISNPSLESLIAVASPAETEFLYFVVDCEATIPGSHVFSTTFEEHLVNVERCR